MPQLRSDSAKTERTVRFSTGEELHYTLVRSSRRSVGVEITPEGNVIVRAPMRLNLLSIGQFLTEHESWILTHLEKAKKKKREAEGEAALAPITRGEIKLLADKALKEIPPRVSMYAARIGVTYGRITIRNQTTVWGSCTSKGNLNFNCLLMKMPEEVVDYVIIHELCHRLEMNHSPRFWAQVARYCPSYKERRKWLKENGTAYITAMKNGR